MHWQYFKIKQLVSIIILALTITACSQDETVVYRTTSAPQITLVGTNPQAVIQGELYIEAGATATDAEDGNLSSSIQISENVDTAALGVYNVLYRVTDSSGNISTTTRTVNVETPEDTIAPVITLLGTNPAEMVQDGNYTDSGATAMDNRDGALTVEMTGSVDTSTAGTYTLLYMAKDQANNVAIAIRTVNVTSSLDTTPPVITLNGESNLTLIQNVEPYIELGATAVDNLDGNLTAEIETSGTVDIATIGVYTITYAVRDNSGFRTVVTRTVNIITRFIREAADETVFDRYTDLTWQDDNDSEFTTKNWQDAMDSCLDLTLAGYDDWFLPDQNTLSGIFGADSFIHIASSDYWSRVEAEGSAYSVSTINGQIGIYDKTTLLYYRCGREVDTTPPLLNIQGGDITLYTGEVYVENVTASDIVDGDLSANIIISGDLVDTSVAGTYVIAYSVSDSAGNEQTGSRTVNVIEDTIGAVITILGDNPMIVDLGTPYVENAATAFDAKDGDVTANIITSGTVDTNSEGNYTITYTVSDNALNQTVATRTVQVIDFYTRDAVTEIVTDNIRSLRWVDDASVGVLQSWSAAGTFCASLNMRLPTVVELNTIIYTANTPTINYADFDFATAGAYWTSTYNIARNFGTIIDFSDGTSDSGYSGDAYVRCVESF